MIFDVVIPTYKRIEKLRRCLSSIFLIKGLRDKIRVHIYFDNNDKEGFNSNLFYAKLNTVGAIDFKVFDSGTRQVLKKQHRAFGIWNLHLRSMVADGIFYICDDVELYPGCLMNAINDFKKLYPDTDGMIGINQCNIPLNDEGYSVFAMGLIGKRFAEHYTCHHEACFCPDYKSFHADTELGLFAKSQNKFHYCQEAKLFHYHPAHCKEEIDETHNIVRKAEIVNKDRNTWNKRQKKGLLWGKSFELIAEAK